MTVDFMVSEELCINEVINFKNASSNSNYFIWDFCNNHLSVPPAATNLGAVQNASRIEAIDYIETLNFDYVFVVSRDIGDVLRLQFEKGFKGNPKITNLGNFSGLVITPTGVKLVNDNDNWYALITSSGNNRLLRLNFGNSLENSPTINDLGGFSSLSNPFSLDVVWDGQKYIVGIVSYNANRLNLINFGNTIANTPSTADVITIGNTFGILQPFGISIGVTNNNWYAFVSNHINGRIVRLSFGPELFYGNPSFSEITTLTNPTELQILKENTKDFLFVMLRNQGLQKLSFENGLGSNATNTNLGNFAQLSDARSLAIKKDGDKFVALSGHFTNNQLVRMQFKGDCSQNISINSSLDFEPINVFFKNPGQFPIQLTGYDSNGIPRSLIRNITVKDESAPNIAFTTDNFCLGQNNSFILEDTISEIISFSWDFNGDGNINSNEPSPTHQFTDAGAYTVRLDAVAENGCSNFAQKEINIYNPPEPDFEFEEDVVCSNAPLALINTSIHDAPDSLLTWTWDFNEEGTANQRDPSFTFPQGGDKEVSLTAAIPGCEATISKNIFITAGPQVDFNVTGNCLNEPFTFENLTTGERITGFQWDFNDGYFAEVTNPIHEFEEPGTFAVNLQAQNEEGCRTEITKNVFVRDLPSVNFEWELPCRSNPVQIYDRSTVRLANIAQRNWTWSDPGGESASAANLQNPFFTPQSAGIYQLKLKATSNFGCADSLTQNIEVLPAPLADFTTERLCTGQSARFEAQVDYPEGNITRYDWLIDGTLYTGPSVTRTFNQARPFNASLLVRADNLCESVVNKSLQIFPTPTVSIAHTALCNNQDIRFTPVVSSIDPVAQYTWSVNNVPSGEEEVFVRRFTTPGFRSIAIQVNTLNGCQGRVEQPFDIAQSPIAAFEPLPSQGARPLRVQFENTSQFADTYRWFFRESAAQGSTAVNPEFIYTDEATERAMLIAENAAGCADTAYAFIEIMKPLLDVALMRISTQTTGDRLQFNLDIENRGSVVIEDMDILADLGGSLQLYEKMNRRLFSGERIDYPLAYSLRQLDYQEIHHVCFTLLPNVSGLEDVNPLDNKDCLTLSGSFQLLDLYPNPVIDRVYIPFVMPSRETLQFRILDSRGNVVADKSYPGLRTGLNVIQWETASLNSGVYLIQLTHEGKSLVKKMVVR